MSLPRTNPKQELIETMDTATEWSGYPDPVFPDEFWIDDSTGERVSTTTNKRKGLPQFYDCGICGHWHPIEWNGDCREDRFRLTTDFLEEEYGQEGQCWQEVPMPTWED